MDVLDQLSNVYLLNSFIGLDQQIGNIMYRVIHKE